MRHPVLICLLGLAWAAAVRAQDAPITVIEAEGKATVQATPVYADFWLHMAASDATFGACMDQAEQFEARMREAIAARSILPNDIEFSAPAIPDANTVEVQVSARLRYNMSNFVSAETGNRQFAGLCDKVADLAKDMGAALEGPLFSVQTPEALARAAIAKATESAYPYAEAIATELKTSIFAVASVNVVNVAWNEQEDTRAPQPTVRRVACTATVRVSYEVAVTP